MAKASKRKSERPLDEQIVFHPRTADPGLTAFRRAVGSFSLTGPVPSKTFLDDPVQRLTDRARD